jgi:hypothetical protein
MRHLAPSYGMANRDLMRRFARWVADHEERGCGNPWGGESIADDGRRVRWGCRCTCADHNCAALDAPPACATCGDAGVVSASRVRDTPEFGKARACPDCTPAAVQQRMDYARRLVGLTPEQVAASPLTALDAGSTAREGTALWLGNDCQPPTLLLSGPTGTGKTHAAIGATGRLLDRGHSVYFTTATELLQTLRETFEPGEKRSLEDVIKVPLRTGVLVLDDLGAEKQTEFAHEQLFRIVNSRYSGGRITIVTTNLTRQQAPRDRLWSRLFGDRFATIIATAGRDRRRED